MSKFRISSKIVSYLDELQRKEGRFKLGYYIRLAIYLEASRNV